MSDVDGLTARTKRSPAIASPPSLYQFKALSVQVRLLWPAGLALVMALGVAASIPVAMSQRVWITFFALGTALPVTLALVLAIGPRKSSPLVIRANRGLALLASVFALGVGVVHSASYHWEAVAALIQVLAVLIMATLTRGSEKRPRAIQAIGAAVVWAAVSLAAWGVAGSLLWWQLPVGFGHPWTLAILTASALTVAGALWRPDAVANRLVGWVGTGVALVLLAMASLRTNGLFEVSSYMYHWEFYVGPAELVRQGGWLLWDVPAQYGFLSELTIASIPVTSPWEGLFILNSLMCFLLATTVFVLLRSLGRGILNLGMSFTVTSVACFFRPGIGPSIAGPNEYPSTGAFRFLWCVALLLILVIVLRVHSSRARLAILVVGNLIWVLGVLWSAESAIYSTFVWLPGYLLMLVAERWNQPDRRRILSIGVLGAVPALLLAAAVAGVLLVYQIGLGHGPDLQAFYEYGLTYQAGFGAYPIDSGGPVWVLFLAFIATLVTLMWNARKQPVAASVVLVATAAMIYSTSSYFVGRSHPSNVWNLAPEICIALAVTLALAARHKRDDPVPGLLRLVAAPVLIIFLLGALANRSALVDWVTRPQRDITHMETALKPTNPSLEALLEAHVNPGDPIVYLATDADPVLSPHLYGSAEQPNGAPLWLPLVPFAGVNILPPARRVTYLERFIARHPEGGWLIERTGTQSRDEWVIQVVEAHFTPGPTYTNADFQLTFWRPTVGSQ